MDQHNHEGLLTQFRELTQCSEAVAVQYLTANRWDVSSAAAEYFVSLEEGGQGEQGGEDDESQMEEAEAPYTGPRTLDGRPAPASIPSVNSSSRAASLPKKGGFATLGSLSQAGSSSHAGHGHDHDEDDDDDDDDDYEPGEEPRDLFAGGEKSGLAVQDPSNRNDPRKVVNDILKKARANAQRPGGEPSTASPSRFHGSGMTLGGDDTPSQLVPSSHTTAPEPAQTQTRILHLWEDGFSIEDGPLHRFDDPQNANDLQMIRQGRAPLHLMGVQPEQPVDVQLIKHDTKFKAPPKVYKPFSGSGQRLGSPTPGVASPAAQPQTPAASATSSTASAINEPKIDSSQPTVTLRIQLGNGTRLPARFNTAHTLGDVYDFVGRANPESSRRPWVLATTFPNKDHTDKSLVLGELPEFKRGGTAVQKWT